VKNKPVHHWCGGFEVPNTSMAAMSGNFKSKTTPDHQRYRCGFESEIRSLPGTKTRRISDSPHWRFSGTMPDLYSEIAGMTR